METRRLHQVWRGHVQADAPPKRHRGRGRFRILVLPATVALLASAAAPAAVGAASAILTVCYPDEFTVYDIRVCGMLGGYRGLEAVKFERMWEGYQEFMGAVKRKAPAGLSLRDKDRWLWGKSRYEELRNRL